MSLAAMKDAFYPLGSGLSSYCCARSWLKVEFRFFVHEVKQGVLSSVTVNSGGQIKVNVYNITSQTIYLTRKASLIYLTGARMNIRKFGTGKI